MNEITIIQAISATIGLMSFVILFVTLICALIAKTYLSKTGKILLWMTVTLMLASLVDSINWYLDGTNMGSIWFSITQVVDYVLFLVFLSFLHFYIIERIELQIKCMSIYRYAPIYLFTILSVAWTASLWTGWFYEIRPDEYVIGEYYAWSQLPIAAVFILDLALIVTKLVKNWNSAEVSNVDYLSWTAYIILGIGSFAISFEYDEIPVVYFGSALIVIVSHLGLELHKEVMYRTQKIELELSKAQLAQSQIKPHFLYNCLATIEVLCKINPVMAGEMVKRFTNFMRGITDNISQREMITFEEELYIINNYMYLEKIRFQNKIHFEKNIVIEKFLIPPLTVEPLVENAVKHGVTKKVTGGTIWIETYLTDSEVVIEVRDDGVGFDMDGTMDPNRKHVGLENVNDRLRLLCGGRLEISSKVNEGCVATIYLPKKSALKVKE